MPPSFGAGADALSHRPMHVLWAPWRMAYIGVPQEPGCIFCDKPAAQTDEENLILHRGETAFVVLNLFPYSNGHLMVAPYQHTGELESLDGTTLKEMMLLVALGIRALRALMAGDGATHDAKVGAALKELSQQVEVIVLAQASMARVVDSLTAAEKRVPILASPGIAVDYLATVL